MRQKIILSVLCVLFIGVGCRRDDEIQTYRVSKEAAPAMPITEKPSSREIEWTLPAGWKEQPASAMRVGSFLAKGSNGSQADISIVPLSSEAGSELANINRWRGQLNLDPITEAELPKTSETITPGGRSMLLVDFANSSKRLVATMYKRGGRTWFFKMTGDTKTVQEVKPAFLQFLTSLRFHGRA